MEELDGVNGEKAQMRGLPERCEATPLRPVYHVCSTPAALPQGNLGRTIKCSEKYLGNLRS